MIRARDCIRFERVVVTVIDTVVPILIVRAIRVLQRDFDGELIVSNLNFIFSVKRTLEDIDTALQGVVGNNCAHGLNLFNRTISFKGHVAQDTIYQHRMIDDGVQLEMTINVFFRYGVVMTALDDNIGLTIIGNLCMLIDINTHVLSLGKQNHSARSNFQGVIPAIFRVIPAKRPIQVIMLIRTGIGATSIRLTVLGNQVLQIIQRIRLPDMKLDLILIGNSIIRIIFPKELIQLIQIQAVFPVLYKIHFRTGQIDRILRP